MIAVGKSISYGAAYAEYATQKDQAVFLGARNMDGDYSFIFDNSELSNIWLEFKNAEKNRKVPGRKIKNNLVAIELSPSPEESAGWSEDDYFRYALKHIEEMDKQEIAFKYRKRGKDGNFVKDSDDKDKWFNGIVPRTNFTNSKMAAMLHRDSKSGICHIHMILSVFDVDGNVNDTREIPKRAARAAEKINEQMGWKSADKISTNHKVEIKNMLYDVLRELPAFSWDAFKQAVEEKKFKNYRGYNHWYEVKFRQSGDDVVGYSVKRGNSIYSASQVGANLTAKKIEKEWQKLHSENIISRKPEPEEKQPIHDASNHSKVDRMPAIPETPALNDAVHYSYKGYEISMSKEVDDYIRNHIELPEYWEYEGEVDDDGEEYMPELPQIEEVMTTAVAMFTGLWNAATSVDGVSSGGGGVGSSDNDDDWRKRAAEAAKNASIWHTPYHKNSGTGYGRRR